MMFRVTFGRFCRAILLAFTVGITPIASSPAHAFSIQLKGDAPDRIERQRAAIRGQLPLAGTPDLANLDQRLASKGLKRGNAVFVRVFKKSSELELWMERGGQFVHFATYPMCHWDGALGPKLHEGDRQSPEGFYTVTRRQMRPSRRWPKHFNLGFPNAYDRAHKRTGSYLLIHGGCTSVGCFALTDDVIEEVYGLARSALRNGQRRFHVHVLPFRMTGANLAATSDAVWQTFWRDLKKINDLFEKTKRPPRIAVCRKRYVGVQSENLNEASRAVASYCPQTPEAAPQHVAQAEPPLPVRSASIASAPQTTVSQIADAQKINRRNGARQPARLKRPTPIKIVDIAEVARRSTGRRSSKRSSRRTRLSRKRTRRVNTTKRMSLGVARCNSGLASCRKFLALQRRRAAARRRNLVRNRSRARVRRPAKKRLRNQTRNRNRTRNRKRIRKRRKTSAVSKSVKTAANFHVIGFQ